MEKAKEEELQKLREEVEEAQNLTFESIKETIYSEIRQSPELAELEKQLLIDVTPEGLRIQIVDEDGRSMFPSGKATMFDFMRELLTKVTQIIIPQPNQISVRGHTDGVPYPDGATYDNWNLSADRALASRSVMLDSGLASARTENVLGRADREHLLPDEPLSSRNRRISIVLLRQALETEEQLNEVAEQYGVVEPTEDSLENSDVILEDRSDIPELDRTIDESPEDVIPDAQDANTINQESTIADEIKKLREQKENQNNAIPNRQPTLNDDSQYLQF
jgi:outer membrane protein OmpA-like peptidoglycan-associated protein